MVMISIQIDLSRGVLIAKTSVDLFDEKSSESDNDANFSDITDEGTRPNPVQDFQPLVSKTQENIEIEFKSQIRKKLTVFNSPNGMGVDLESFIYQVIDLPELFSCFYQNNL